MSLSDHDQEIFAQMENQFKSQFKDDKTFKSMGRKSPKVKTATVIVVGVLLIVAGIVTLIAGVAVSQILLGLLGFAIMFTGALFLYNRFIENVNREMYAHRR